MTNKFSETMLADIPVLCVEVTGVQNSGKAFSELEAKIGSLRGRRFYGTLIGASNTGTYRACVVLVDGEDADSLGLKPWIIPGGKYLKYKLVDWVDKLDLIGSIFKEMFGYAVCDPSRPQIEFYRSQKELILMMPVR